MKFKILMIGYVWPEPNSSAAGLRDYNLLETFLSAGWEVAYTSQAKENEASLALKDRGIPTFSFPPNDAKFDLFIREFMPDFVLFDRFVTEEQFGWRVQEGCPDAVRILDTQDLHLLRRGRARALEEGRTLEEIKNCEFNLQTEDAWREIGSIFRSDCTLVLSDFELSLLSREFKIPSELLYLSRFHYPVPPEPHPLEQRKNFAMIGNFRHAPNADAVSWVHQEIWPLIRKEIPEAEVHIYGAYPSQDMMKLSDRSSGFMMKGWAKTPFETLRQYRVTLAPLRFGAGIKGKISDSWWSGTPVITTPIGAEGMSEDLPWGGEIGKTPIEIAEKAIHLYSDRGKFEDGQKNGFALMDALYDETKNRKSLTAFLIQVLENLQKRRRKNLVGSLLQFHMNRSTKYFSKWIELKNQQRPEQSSS